MFGFIRSFLVSGWAKDELEKSKLRTEVLALRQTIDDLTRNNRDLWTQTREIIDRLTKATEEVARLRANLN